MTIRLNPVAAAKHASHGKRAYHAHPSMYEWPFCSAQNGFAAAIDNAKITNRIDRAFRPLRNRFVMVLAYTSRWS
ncbi:hypothetical protein NDK47_11200 [Brevibacillus ruminantium]|uniref:Transposase n=1 Tax=Brevibacillus ruminantium TaxID=2950604 RepID=A0ABY4WM98_9BACL|nr:hypothetical protein [Brevibacillus ruminantium]USG67799.1 hypothetical protein NDK47_11200 [Brevibacillus ruminantium]